MSIQNSEPITGKRIDLEPELSLGGTSSFEEPQFEDLDEEDVKKFPDFADQIDLQKRKKEI